MSLPIGCNPKCPACAHRELSMEASLAQKAGWLARRLAPWTDCLQPVQHVSEQRQWGYRDRVSLSAQWLDEHWQFGVFRRDEFIAIPGCPIQSGRVNKTIALLSEHLPPPDNFKLAFLAQSGAQTVLILKQSKLPSTPWFTEVLIKALNDIGIEGVWIHCFPSAGRNLFTKNGWYKLWGSERSRDDDGFWYGPGAFSQLLPELHKASLDEAEMFLAPNPDDKVLDLYCGRGISLNRWHQAGAKTLGVEVGRESIECAKLNMPDANILRGTCVQRLPQINEWWKEAPPEQRLAYVNPPRTGLERSVTEWLAEQGRPVRIAYLSCSAGTLSRDLTQLCEAGYKVERITPYDLFPRTYHVETLALLSRSTKENG